MWPVRLREVVREHLPQIRAAKSRMGVGTEMGLTPSGMRRRSKWVTVRHSIGRGRTEPADRPGAQHTVHREGCTEIIGFLRRKTSERKGGGSGNVGERTRPHNVGSCRGCAVTTSVHTLSPGVTI